MKKTKRSTPRQRIMLLNKEIGCLNEIVLISTCEQEFCGICEHFYVWRGYDYEEPECRLFASAWERGDEPILRCRKFRAVKAWRERVLLILNTAQSEVIDALRMRITLLEIEARRLRGDV